MKYIKRLIETALEEALARGKSILLLGALQTGKTTLIDQLPADFSISFAHPKIRQRYEQNPSIIRAEALVRNIGIFGRFLSLAAAESGDIVNFHKLSQEIGVAHTTIVKPGELEYLKMFRQDLEDTCNTTRCLGDIPCGLSSAPSPIF